VVATDYEILIKLDERECIFNKEYTIDDFKLNYYFDFDLIEKINQYRELLYKKFGKSFTITNSNKLEDKKKNPKLLTKSLYFLVFQKYC